ncbi:MAG: hypothetical protein SNH73_07120 [Rikenellaceae bacterium]
MTANKNLLIGKWRFIKAEQHNGSEWEPISHTNGMSWEFSPEYISETKSIGVIVETAPLVDEVRLNYTFSDRDNLLRIELYTDPQTRIKDETDIYSLSEITQTATQSTIVLSLINCLSCPPPYLRYTLQLDSRQCSLG